MTVLLKRHSVAANDNQGFCMHSFRSGGAISQACAGNANNYAEGILEEHENGMEVYEVSLSAFARNDGVREGPGDYA